MQNESNLNIALVPPSSHTRLSLLYEVAGLLIWLNAFTKILKHMAIKDKLSGSNFKEACPEFFEDE